MKNPKELNFEFPKQLPWSNLGVKGFYNRTQQQVKVNDNGETKTTTYYAFYEKDVGFGFKHAIEIQSTWMEKNPDKPLILVKTLSSCCKMRNDVPDRYLIIREDYYLTVQEAIDALLGKTKVYPPKRKPEGIRKMTSVEVRQYWEIPIVYDNEGKTMDRYTVVIGDAVYTMSKNPHHPQGVNQFCCNTSQLKKNALNEENLVDYDDLPIEVQEAIKERIS